MQEPIKYGEFYVIDLNKLGRDLTLADLILISKNYEVSHKNAKLAHSFPGNDSSSRAKPSDQHNESGGGLAVPYQNEQKAYYDTHKAPPIWVTPVPATFYISEYKNSFQSQHGLIKHYIAGLYFQVGLGNGICVPIRTINSKIGSGIPKYNAMLNMEVDHSFDHPDIDPEFERLKLKPPITNAQEYAWGAGIDPYFCHSHGAYLEDELNKLSLFMQKLNKAGSLEEQQKLIQTLDKDYQEAFVLAQVNKTAEFLNEVKPVPVVQKETNSHTSAKPETKAMAVDKAVPQPKPNVSKSVSNASSFKVAAKDIPQARKQNKNSPLTPNINRIMQILTKANILHDPRYQEELKEALDSLSEMEHSHNKVIVDRATQILMKEEVENSEYWKVAKDIFTAIHPNAGYMFDLTFDSEGRLDKLNKINFRTNLKQDRHVTPISMIKHLFEEILQKGMTVEEARTAILGQIEIFKTGMGINLHLTKAIKIVKNYFNQMDVDGKGNHVENLLKNLSTCYDEKTLAAFKDKFSSTIKKAMSRQEVEKIVLNEIEEYEDSLSNAHKSEAENYVQAIFDYYRHPEKVSSPDHLKELLKIVAHFYNGKAQLVMSDGYISIPDKTPDRFLLPTLDFGGAKIFYDRSKDPKNSEKDSEKDAEGAFIGMQNKILTSFNWILFLGTLENTNASVKKEYRHIIETDKNGNYQLKDVFATKLLSGDAIKKINERAKQIQGSLDGMMEVDNEDKVKKTTLLSAQELAKVIYSIYTMFDYFPLAPSAVNPTDKGLPDPNKHRYREEPETRLYEVAANHLQFVFSAYPMLREYYQDEIINGFLGYLTYGVTPENVKQVGLDKLIADENKQRIEQNKKIDVAMSSSKKTKTPKKSLEKLPILNLQDFTNAGKAQGFSQQYTTVSAEQFYKEFCEQVREKLSIRDSSYHSVDTNPLSPSLPDFDSQILNEDHNHIFDLASIVLYKYFSYDNKLQGDFAKLPEAIINGLQINGDEFHRLFEKKLAQINDDIENEEADYLPNKLRYFLAIKQAYYEIQEEKEKDEEHYQPVKFISIIKLFKGAPQNSKTNGEEFDKEDSFDENYQSRIDSEDEEPEQAWWQALNDLYESDEDELTEDILLGTTETSNTSISLIGPRSITAEINTNGIFNPLALAIADLILTEQFPEGKRAEFYALAQKQLGLAEPTQLALKAWLNSKSPAEIQEKLGLLLKDLTVAELKNNHSKYYQYYFKERLNAAFNEFSQDDTFRNTEFSKHSFIWEKFNELLKDSSISDKHTVLNQWWDAQGFTQYIEHISQKDFVLNSNAWESRLEIDALVINLGINLNSNDESNNQIHLGQKGGIIPFDLKNLKHIIQINQMIERNIGIYSSGCFRLNEIASIEELKQLLGPASNKASQALSDFLMTGDANRVFAVTDDNVEVITELMQRGILAYKGDDFYLAIHDFPQLRSRINGIPTVPISDDILKNFVEYVKQYNIDKTPVPLTNENIDIISELVRYRLLARDNKTNHYYPVATSLESINIHSKGFAQEDIKFIMDNFQPLSPSIKIETNGKYWHYQRPMDIRKKLEHVTSHRTEIPQSKNFGKSFSAKTNTERPQAILTEGDGNCAFNGLALGITDLAATNQLPENGGNERQAFYSLLQLRLNLDNPTQESFKLWLQDKSPVQIQKMLAPVLREFAVDRIRAQYALLYQEGYEIRLHNAFDLFMQGSAHEDDTFIVHKFISDKFEQLQKLPETSQDKALIDWWKLTGREQYFKAIAQPALNALDIAKWGSDVEPAAVAFNLGIGFSWKKFGGTQSLSVGGGLIPITLDNFLALEQLRNRGVGDFYLGTFRLDEFPKLEYLKQILGPAKQETVDGLNEFLEGGDPKRPFVLTKPNPIIENELIQRQILTGKLIDGEHQWFLADLTKVEMNARLIALPELTAKLATEHYQPNIPKLMLENSGGHWTYYRSTEVSKKLALVSTPPSIDLSHSTSPKSSDAESISPATVKQDLVTEGLIAAMKTKVGCAGLMIAYIKDSYQLSINSGVESDAERNKVIVFLATNNIGFSFTPPNITVDSKQMELIKKLLPSEILNTQSDEPNTKKRARDDVLGTDKVENDDAIPIESKSKRVKSNETGDANLASPPSISLPLDKKETPVSTRAQTMPSLNASGKPINPKWQQLSAIFHPEKRAYEGKQDSVEMGDGTRIESKPKRVKTSDNESINQGLPPSMGPLGPGSRGGQ